MKKVIKDWDQYRYSFIKQSLRRATFRWPACGEARKLARTERKTNPTTGKLCWHAKCAGCNKEFLEKELQLDHKQPVIPTDALVLPGMRSAVQTAGYSDQYLGQTLRRMLPETAGWQCLCSNCHLEKTRRENEQRKQTKHSSTA